MEIGRDMMEVKRLIKKVRTSQLNINLPPSFINRDLEILIITLDKPGQSEKKRKRKPPMELAGKIEECGDVMSSAPLSEWGKVL
jgi:hypothetical protein